MKHVHWEFSYEKGWWLCSACKKEALCDRGSHSERLSRCCPWCGARMDGDDQSDECGVYDDEGNKVTVCACGTEISPHAFQLADECYGETHKVQVLRCKDCGKLSFGWWSL